MRDRRGVSAIEFAMIVPILILMYVGVAEIGNALTIYRRTSSVASTAADLTEQTKTVSTADLQDIAAASSSILTPYSTTPLKIVLSSVVADEDNNGKVAWSYANKGGGRATNSAYAVPAGLTEPNSSVIVAEITYSFTPLLNLSNI
ncbi:MAG: TadE/TadG family type IV pilus assembly protein, partial [Methyloceanibacter sp.]